MAHSASTPHPGARPTGAEEPSIGTLVQSAMADVSTLVRSEIELAKSEIGKSAKKAAIGGAAFGAAAVLLVFAGIYFFFFLAELLDVWLWRWAAFLVVFGILVVFAGVTAVVGRRFVKRIDKPERTLESLRELPDVMHREAPGQRRRDLPVVAPGGQVTKRGPDSYLV
ncbi:phage holin family protein [Blastococcus sp. SYSU D00695]